MKAVVTTAAATWAVALSCTASRLGSMLATATGVAMAFPAVLASLTPATRLRVGRGWRRTTCQT